jgi:hypothetical protein
MGNYFIITNIGNCFYWSRERIVLIVTLFDRDKVFNLVLPEKITGRYILTTVDQVNGH